MISHSQSTSFRCLVPTCNQTFQSFGHLSSHLRAVPAASAVRERHEHWDQIKRLSYDQLTVVGLARCATCHLIFSAKPTQPGVPHGHRPCSGPDEEQPASSAAAAPAGSGSSASVDTPSVADLERLLGIRRRAASRGNSRAGPAGRGARASSRSDAAPQAPPSGPAPAPALASDDLPWWERVGLPEPVVEDHMSRSAWEHKSRAAFSELEVALNAPTIDQTTVFVKFNLICALGQYRRWGRRMCHPLYLAGRQASHQQQRHGLPAMDYATYRAVSLAALRGEPGRAAAVLGGALSAAAYTPEVEEKCRALFPGARPDEPLDHVARSPHAPRACPPATDPEFRERVWKKLHDKRHSTGAGPSGFSMQTLHELFDCSGDESRTAILPLATLISAIANGVFDTPLLRPLVTTALLVPLRKPDGGIRPIGITEAFTRLAGSLLVAAYRSELRGLQTDRDVGHGVAGGPEVVAHAVQAWTSAHPDHVVAKIDFRNAFNELRRFKSRELIARIPGLVPYYNTLYASPSEVMYRPHGSLVAAFVIANVEGNIQGDPLSAPLFSCAVSSALRDIRAAFPECLILSYLDDITVLGPLSQVVEIFRAIGDAFSAQLGLSLRADKSWLLSLSSDPALLAAVQAAAAALGCRMAGPSVAEGDQQPDAGGLEVVGTPFGTPEYVAAFLAAKVRRAEGLLDDLEKTAIGFAMPASIPSVQALYLTIQACIPSQLTFWLRVLPPTVTADAALRLDCSLFNTLMRLLGRRAAELPLPDSTAGRHLRERVFLALETTGLGFISSEKIRDAAYVASWQLSAAALDALLGFRAPAPSFRMDHAPELAVSIERVLPLHEAAEDADDAEDVAAREAGVAPVARERGRLPQDASFFAQAPRRGLQGRLLRVLDQQRLAQILASLPERDPLRPALLSFSVPHSSAWLLASPAIPDNRVDNASFIKLVCFRLQLPLLPRRPGIADAVPCSQCGLPMLLTGAHAFSACQGKPLYYRAHNKVRNQVRRALDKAGHGRLRARSGEPLLVAEGVPLRDAAVTDDLRGRRADVLVVDQQTDKKFFVEIGLTFPTESACGPQIFTDRRRAVDRMTRTKAAAYSDFAFDPLHELAVLVFDHYGASTVEYDAFVRTVSRLVFPGVDREGKPWDLDGLRSIFVRRLREGISVALQRGVSEYLNSWILACAGAEGPPAFWPIRPVGRMNSVEGLHM